MVPSFKIKKIWPNFSTIFRPLFGYFLAAFWLLLTTFWPFFGYFFCNISATFRLLFGHFFAIFLPLFGHFSVTFWLLLGYFFAIFRPLLTIFELLYWPCGVWVVPSFKKAKKFYPTSSFVCPSYHLISSLCFQAFVLFQVWSFSWRCIQWRFWGRNRGHHFKFRLHYSSSLCFSGLDFGRHRSFSFLCQKTRKMVFCSDSSWFGKFGRWKTVEKYRSKFTSYC